MTKEEIQSKLVELRKERNAINNEANEIFAKTRPIQAEIDRLEMLDKGFDYNEFGDNKYVKYYETDSDTTYLVEVCDIHRRNSGVDFEGKVIKYWFIDDEASLVIYTNDNVYVPKGEFDHFGVITKEEFESLAQKAYEGIMPIKKEENEPLSKDKVLKAFNKVLDGFIDTSFDMSKPWEEIFKSHLGI